MPWEQAVKLQSLSSESGAACYSFAALLQCKAQCPGGWGIPCPDGVEALSTGSGIPFLFFF